MPTYEYTMIREDPPDFIAVSPQKRNLRRFSGWLVELRSHPGVWHRYDDLVDPGQIAKVNHGRMAGIEAGEFEATGRRAESDHRYHLWVRYLGWPGGRCSCSRCKAPRRG